MGAEWASAPIRMGKLLVCVMMSAVIPRGVVVVGGVADHPIVLVPTSRSHSVSARWCEKARATDDVGRCQRHHSGSLAAQVLRVITTVPRARGNGLKESDDDRAGQPSR